MSAEHAPWPARVSVLVVAAAFLGCSARILWLVDRHAVDVPFWDQWDLMVPLMEQAGIWELFRFQHGPHRQGIAFVLAAGLARATAWSARAEAFSVVLYVIGAAGLALALTRRLRGRLVLGDAAIPLLVLTPAQYGIFAHTPNASHGAAPLFLLLLFAHALLVADWRLRYGSLLLLDVLLVHTGFGLFVGGLAPLYFVLEGLRARRHDGPTSGSTRAPLAAAIGAGLAALAIAGVFFVDYHFDPAVPGFEVRLADLVGYPRYMALMAANVLGLKGTGIGPSTAGTVVLVLALVAGVRATRRLLRGAPRSESEVVLLFVVFALLFGAMTALGRYALGLPAAQSTRYVPLVVPLFLGLWLSVDALPSERVRRALGAIALVAMLLATVPMRASEASFMARLAERKTRWVEVYLETGEIRSADRAARIKIYPWPPERTRLQQKLDYLEARRLGFFRGRAAESSAPVPPPNESPGG